jgi:GAF domain-containing protein
MKNQFSTLLKQVEALIEGETDLVANMANIAAVLYSNLDDVNWAGFYRVIDQQLVLGPFQGQPACIRIPIGTGVCGTAVSEDKIQLVDDVHQFDGHIACDVNSRSELVIPIRYQKRVIGVLDIDSPELARFNHNDVVEIRKVVSLLEKTLR